MSRLTPEVRAKLAKRRGTARQRQLAMAFNRPLDWLPHETDAAYQAKLEHARQLMRERLSKPRNRETPED